MRLSEETKDYLTKLNGFTGNDFDDLVPIYRIDTSSVWYILFYNKKNNKYEVHWFEGSINNLSSNDVGTTKYYDVPFESTIEEILCWLIGKIQIGAIKQDIEPKIIQSITYIN